ncbi:MAG: NTP transferase domain-containing protein [Wenzhouxiangellaceae bacterium]
MKAIILAAGQGKRLLPLTSDRPKCLVELCGRSLLEHQIRTLAEAGVDEVVVATGFRFDAIERTLAKLEGPLPRIRTVFNPFYAVSDNLATCWMLREEMCGPLLVVNGDTLFETGLAQSVLASPDDWPVRVTVSRKREYDDDDMKVVIEGERVVAIGKQHFSRIDAESIGLLRFSEEGALRFCAMLDSMMREADGKSRWYLAAVDRLAQQGCVAHTDISGLRWCEVDTPKDLAHAPGLLGLAEMPSAGQHRVQGAVRA